MKRKTDSEELPDEIELEEEIDIDDESEDGEEGSHGLNLITVLILLIAASPQYCVFDSALYDAFCAADSV